MPHYIYDGSQPFVLPAYRLNPGDELDILAGAMLIGDHVAGGGLVQANGARINNYGVIANIGATYANDNYFRGSVYLQHGASLYNFGSIFADAGPYSAAVFVANAAADPIAVIVNAGRIGVTTAGQVVGTGSAIAGYGGGLVSIFNTATGIIVGPNGVPSIYGGNGAIIQLVNDGRIGGSTSDTVPLTVMAAAARILNNGSIDAGVDIGTGDMVNNGTVRTVHAQHVQNAGTIEQFVLGTDGNDSIVNSGGIGTVAGGPLGTGVWLGAGDDLLRHDAGSIAGDIDMGPGNDILRITDGTVSGRILGGAGDDVIFGGAAGETIYGDNGLADMAVGTDTIYGGGGADTIFGGYGADRLLGNQGDDILAGNQGDDFIHGGQNNDVISGGDGADTINGGVGDDMLRGDAGDDLFVFSAGFGHDIVADFATSPGNNDTIRFEAGTFADYAAVMDSMSLQGADVVITLDAANSITIRNTMVAALTADHFLFG